MNYYFKNLAISYKKFYPYSKIFSNKPVSYLLSINISNKVYYFLNKILTYIILNTKTQNLFIKNFIIGKGMIIKKLNYRGRGRINFFIKRSTNIFINILYGKKN